MAGSGDRARSVDADGNGRDGVAELQPTWKTIGYSWQGRPLRVTRIGRGLRRVLWIGGIHGDEREGRVGTEELPQAVRAMPGMTDDITLILLEDANPDGSANGTRGNARGVDLNRNYPAPNFRSNRFFGMRPLDQPEARAIHDLVLGERPDLVIVAHSWRNDHFINYDGPAVRLAERFAELSGYRVKESDDIAPTPGSLGSWIGKTLGIPILTLEYRRGRDSRSAWSETRGAILAVMRAG
ncbi:MAG: succinylglutamate desuccinylase/aspartoacylase family protein [Planctomycetes bacterium]|nr:succinylglutamate desuccinylase/aspartoacylase family protein [Planctomycetota bacterium]